MRQIVHGSTPPPQLALTHMDNPSPSDPAEAWKQFTGKQELRDDLWPRQNGRCAYCERCIPVASTPIEHVRPKGGNKFREYTFIYQNLVLSCQTLGTCTDHKDNDWNDSFIPPTDSRCDSWFCCELNGLVQPAAGLPESARTAVETTIRIVNLNHPHLKTARENILMNIE